MTETDENCVLHDVELDARVAVQLGVLILLGQNERVHAQINDIRRVLLRFEQTVRIDERHDRVDVGGYA